MITLPPVLTPRFHDALRYASALHDTQLRKGSNIPYIAHLLAVTGVVLEAGGTEDEAIAAVLHDGPKTEAASRRLRLFERSSARSSPISSRRAAIRSKIRSRSGASAKNSIENISRMPTVPRFW